MKRIWTLGLILALAGCGDLDSDSPDAEAASDPAAPPIEVVAPPETIAAPAEPESEAQDPPLTAGQEIEIPEGVLLAGSRPGSVQRDPRREADLVETRLPAFHIDRLPYPNDPALSPLTGVTREQASAHCEEEGKRLCTELEWERACKGDPNREYPTRGALDVARCEADPSSCASPFGVVSMGVAAYEWTSSDVTAGLGSARYSAVVRGARADDPVAEHRCAARHALDPNDAEAGFRCCRGESATASHYPEEERRHPFRDHAISIEELRAILLTMPELERFAPNFALFTPEQIDEALSRGEVSRETVAFTLVEGVLVFSPEHGEQAWVFAGSDGESTVLAVIHPMPDGSFVHGSSFVIAGESGPPIALGWDYGLRRQVLWGAAWGKTGESGVVEHRDDHRIVIVQR